MRLLLAEDEKSLSKALTAILEHSGYSVDAVYNGKDAVEYLENGEYDGVILDIMMPKMDGFQVLSTIRQEKNTVPVLMLTAKAEIEDKVTGLDLGANDYLTKPFSVIELVSRVKAVLRRCRPRQAAVLRCGGLTVDTQEHTVTAEGARVELTYKEYELLRLFMTHPGRAFTRDKLMELVWGTDYCGESRTVDMHIRTLRQKLGACGDRIETVRGVGYRWEART